VDRRQGIGPRLDSSLGQRPRPLPGDRRESQVRVEHHVADDSHAVDDPFPAEVRRRHPARAEEECRDAIDDHAVELLGHRQVEGAQTGLDVRDREPRLGGRERAGERRVRVAVDEDCSRLLVERGALDSREHARDLFRVAAGAGFEPVRGRPEPELVEEDLRELRIVVLARVEHDFLDAALLERERQRSRLHELRPVPDDGKDFHGGAESTRSVTRKIILSATPLVARSYGATRMLAWYLTRRLQRA
jgi:hypothetical protein